MSPREPQGDKRLISSSGTLPQPANLNYGWHRVKQGPKARWQNKYLFPGIVALVIYATMRLWSRIQFVLLFVTLGKRPVAGQCPSYTEYSKVEISNALSTRSIDTMSPGFSWDAVARCTGSPVYATGHRL